MVSMGHRNNQYARWQWGYDVMMCPVLEVIQDGWEVIMQDNVGQERKQKQFVVFRNIYCFINKYT